MRLSAQSSKITSFLNIFFFFYMQTTPNASGWYDGTCYHHAGTRLNEVLMLIQPNSSIKAKCKDD